MKWVMIIIGVIVMFFIGCSGDTESPDVQITYPANGSVVSGTVNITAEATDNKEVARVEFHIDGSLASTSTSEPYTYSWVTTSLPDSSSHNIYAKAYDAVGNEGISSTVTVIVDNGGSAANLIQNAGFEEGLDYWDPFQYSSGWSSSSSNPHGGSFCARFGFPAGSGYYDASIKTSGYQIYVEANTSYYFSFWIREKDTHDTYDPNITIVDAGISLNGNWYSGPQPPPSETWQFADTILTFPESVNAEVHFQLHGYATSNSAEFAVDDVVLKKQ